MSFRRQYRLANHSQKFPGITLNLELEDSNCTPAVFTGRSKKNSNQNPSTFIAPGIRTAAEAVECMRRIDAIAGVHTVDRQ